MRFEDEGAEWAALRCVGGLWMLRQCGRVRGVVVWTTVLEIEECCELWL